jgi:hypothetical protein
MKTVFFSFVLIFSSMVFAKPSPTDQAPRCVNVGTRSEGWKFAGDPRVRFDHCAGEYAECGAVGTRSEGWYAFEKKSAGLIGWAQCRDSRVVPRCGAIGTRSEGWMIPGQQIRYAHCAGQVAECGAIGSRSEGWYAFTKVPKGLLTWANCSDRRRHMNH